MGGIIMALALFSGGFELRTDAETGIAVYPGARALKRHDSALTLGFWGGSKDFNLSLAKYRSSDSPERVAEFYRAELAKFGPVVDCSAEPDDAACEDAAKEPGIIELRAGKKKDQHIVGISPRRRGGSKLVLIHLRMRGL
jgi:hypothetical protein